MVRKAVYKPDASGHYPVRIFPNTLIFRFSRTLIAKDLTPQQKVEVENFYTGKGFKVRWEF